MRVHLVNPSDVSFGVGVIAPRWLYVLAGATPRSYGDPSITDETLSPFNVEQVAPGDVVGIGIHTSNAYRGYEIGRLVRARGGLPVFGGIHATLFPDEPIERGRASAVVRGDGDLAWAEVLSDCAAGKPKPLYEGGSIDAADFVMARWDLVPRGSYMWASVQTVRGCPKHCSFCSVWRTDGQLPRQRPVDPVVEEVVALRRMGYRFIALADDNFYPVTAQDIERAARQDDKRQYEKLLSLRRERFDLMDRLARISDDLVFFTQITMEAAEDEQFLRAMKSAHIKGALVGVESISAAGLKGMYKGFNLSGEDLVARLKRFRQFDIHVLGSFIFGLQSDTPEVFEATSELADRAELTFAQFLPFTLFPGTVDFEKWEKDKMGACASSEGTNLTRPWLIAASDRPKLYSPHPTMSADEIREYTQKVWSSFYRLSKIWKRSRCVSKLRSRLAFVLISKLYRQMYANTGMADKSSGHAKAVRWARIIARPCHALFSARPMPQIQVPEPAQLPE
ncbi:MAG: (dimethylallyl)adenosine tRNA methylthiotransferase [Acidobacteria bacterium]|nr:(dimethylallyl)adenosine tRNA methylthiotransferase [Acidobacteriota bacterium]